MVMPRRRQLSRIARGALSAVAGLGPRYDITGGPSINHHIDRLLYGGFLAIERALHVLGILDNEGKGLETYSTCCATYQDKLASQTQGWSPKAVVVAALDVVTEITGRDPRDPANWVDPEDADWAYVTQISRALWDLLGQESDPFNTLYCAPGDAAG